jgi:hypothetical protein
MWCPTLPTLECAAAAPANHDHYAFLITTLEEIIGTARSFHPQRIHIHEFQVMKIGIYTLVGGTHHEVFHVSTTTDHYVFAIHLEHLGTMVVELVHP